MSERIFTRHHVWVLPGSDQDCMLGITDYAQQQLGDIVYVELPIAGTSTQVDAPCLVVESVKSASDVICPVQGEISQINDALNNEPELINESPYNLGWIVRIKLSQESAIEGKMTEDEYNNYVSENSN